MRVKLIDLYNIDFDKMEQTINEKIEVLEENDHEVQEVKVLGDALKNGAVFIVYK